MYRHVGHFALVQALLPILEHTAALPNSDVRVITVSSVAHALIKTFSWKTSQISTLPTPQILPPSTPSKPSKIGTILPSSLISSLPRSFKGA